MKEFEITNVIGEITCEPTLYYFQNGKCRCNFSVTVDQNITGLISCKNHTDITYLCEAYNKLALKISRELRLNEYVLFQGKIINYESLPKANEFGFAVLDYNFLPFEFFDFLM